MLTTEVNNNIEKIKDIFTEEYPSRAEKGEYTINVTLWTDDTYQIELNSNGFLGGCYDMIIVRYESSTDKFERFRHKDRFIVVKNRQVVKTFGYDNKKEMLVELKEI